MSDFCHKVDSKWYVNDGKFYAPYSADNKNWQELSLKYIWT